MNARELFGYYRSTHPRTTALRMTLAATVGPLLWPAWYLAPAWKRDQWHKIGCERDPGECPTCSRYYGLDA